MQPTPTQVPLQTLYTFFVVCRAGSMKDAAQLLSVTPGAISQRMRGLEQRHGQRLFARTRVGVSPTDAGAKLYAQLRGAFAQIETVARHALQGRDGGTQLIVSVLPSFASSWLLPRLGGFAQRCPKVSLTIETDPKVVDLRTEPVDFAIRHGLGKYPGLEARWLMSPEMVMVATPALLHGGPSIKSPADCLAYPLLHDSDRHDWSLWLQAHGTTSARARRGLSFTDQHLLVRAAAQGQGLALVRRLYAQADLARGTLVQPLDVQWPSQFGYYLVGLPGSFETAAGWGFAQWLLEEAQGDQAHGANRTTDD
jgi:LysR family transcriptional regulator, glycine cleavage system transcriptional activator